MMENLFSSMKWSHLKSKVHDLNHLFFSLNIISLSPGKCSFLELKLLLKFVLYYAFLDIKAGNDFVEFLVRIWCSLAFESFIDL